MAILATGLRSRKDALLRMQLLGRTMARVADGEDAANLAFACGLAADPMAVPELTRGARKGIFAGRRLSDVERSHAIQALGLSGDPGVLATLEMVLRSRRVGLQSRRGAALALGRVLREEQPPTAAADRAVATLVGVFSKSSDPLLRGFCALALGGARPPRALIPLREAIDHGGNMDLKPFCALALGLAARTLPEKRERRRTQAFLAEELGKTHAAELEAALSLALGLAEAHEARPLLLERLKSRSSPAPARGAAAQALGLLGDPDPEVLKTLRQVMKRESSGPLLEDTVLALGLLGRRSVAADLVKLLARAGSSQVQGRLILALAHLDHSAAVDPLLEVVTNRRQRPLVREFAAVALGLLGDRRVIDPFFEIDAYFNYCATTRATHEWLRLY